jgi:hypothetical protein
MRQSNKFIWFKLFNKSTFGFDYLCNHIFHFFHQICDSGPAVLGQLEYDEFKIIHCDGLDKTVTS